MNPTLIIQFDLETWKPTTVIINGDTDLKTANARKIADKALVVLEVSENENT
jgi:hypothetical protein